MVYTVSVSGKEKYLSFNEWETIKSSTSGSLEQYQNPKGLMVQVIRGWWLLRNVWASWYSFFWYCVAPVDGRVGKAAQLKTLHTAIVANGIDYNAAFGGLIPYITAGSLFTGTFKTDMFNPLNSTKFGVPFVGDL